MNTTEPGPKSLADASSAPVPRTADNDICQVVKRNDEVRDAILRPLTQHSALMISSAMPSQKYSWSCSGLMSRNGRMATDSAGGSALGCFLAEMGEDVATGSSGDKSAVRSTPFGVTSNAQASTHANGSPRIARVMTSLTVHAGSPMGSNVVSAIWISSQATMA